MIVAAPDVSRETHERLERFAQLVTEWTKRINLISKGDLPHLRTRHIDDSLQLAALVEGRAKTWLDIGSGGGFPGIVLAILNKEALPDATHVLIESDKRKSAFLIAVIAELGLAARVLPIRSEEAPPQSADVVTARAFAPLADLLPHVARHMAPDGEAILPKGATAETELAEARQRWSFALTAHPSRTNPQGTIFRMTELSHG